MRFKPLESKEEWAWFQRRTRVILCEDTQGIVAVSEQGGILGAAVFDTWTPSSVNVHMALGSPIPIRHGFFAEVAVHAFVRGGKKRMFGLVPSNNAKAIKLDQHIGFREVARVPDALDDGVDYIVMRLDKEDCRWLPEEFREAA